MPWAPCRLWLSACLSAFALGCASGPAVRIRAAGVEERVVRPGKLQPVELSREELQSAIRKLTAHLTPPRMAAMSVVADIRLASSDEAEKALVTDYLRWCEETRRGVGDCLGVLSPSGLLTADAKEKMALEVALSSALLEAAQALGSITPLELRVMILGAMTTYVGLLLLPTGASQFIAITMTCNLIAFLGVDLFNNVFRGYLDMKEQASAATSFAAVHAAGERYAARLGPSAGRVVVMLATYGVAKLSGVGPASAAQLPGGARAAALAEAQGFQLGAVAEAQSVAVAADGTVTIALGSRVAMAAAGERDGSGVENRIAGRTSPLTRQEARQLADRLGFQEVRDPPFQSHGQPIFQRGDRYITPDRDVHRGGTWKLFDKKGNRPGTYNDDLSFRIGD